MSIDIRETWSQCSFLRYNILTEMPEYKAKDENTYRMVDKRVMNSICIKAMMYGTDGKDVDVKRLLYSEQIPTYHPLKDYLAALPEWDGTDRVTMLAARVSLIAIVGGIYFYLEDKKEIRTH